MYCVLSKLESVLIYQYSALKLYCIIEPLREKTNNLHKLCENKDADQLRGSREAISVFVFATWIVQSLYLLNTKFHVSSYLLSLYNPVCVRPGRKPKFLVLSRSGSYLFGYDNV